MSDSECCSRKLTAKERNIFDSDEESSYVRNKKKVQPKSYTSKRGIESDEESTIVRNKKKALPKPSTSKRGIESDDDEPTRNNKKLLPKPTTSKRQPNESDAETVFRRKKESKAPTKRKRLQSASLAKKSEDISRIFDSESEDDTNCKPQQLRSSYSKRIAYGALRRSAQLEGELYLDVKLYQAVDIKNVHPHKRHEKAVLSLKYQADHDAPELELLQQLLKRCKIRFPEEAFFFAETPRIRSKLF